MIDYDAIQVEQFHDKDNRCWKLKAGIKIQAQKCVSDIAAETSRFGDLLNVNKDQLRKEVLHSLYGDLVRELNEAYRKAMRASATFEGSEEVKAAFSKLFGMLHATPERNYDVEIASDGTPRATRAIAEGELFSVSPEAMQAIVNQRAKSGSLV